MPKIASPRRLAGRTATLVSVLVLVALALPVSAQAIWSAPITLSPTGHSAYDPEVGVDQGGNAVFIWRRPDGTTDCGGRPGCFSVEVGARSATGTLSTVQTVSPPQRETEAPPQLAVDQSGNAVITWDEFNGTTIPPIDVQTRARSAAGVLSAIQMVSTSGQESFDPDVAVDQDGDAVYVWQGYTVDCSPCYAIQTRARSAAGSLSATQVLSDASDFDTPTALGVDQDGDAVFAWQRRDGTTNCSSHSGGCYRIQTRARSASGALSATQTLSLGTRDAFSPQVGVDQAGNAVFVWQRRDSTTDCGGEPCSRVQARARSADGTLSGIQTLSGPGEHSDRPQVAVNPSGNAVVAWIRNDSTTGCGGNGCDRVVTRARAPDGSLSATQTLSPPGNHAFNPHVGIDQSGNAVVVWGRPDETTDCDGFACRRVQARVRSAAGTLSATKTLSAGSAHADEAQIAINPSGSAVVVWSRFGGVFQRIQAAVGP